MNHTTDARVLFDEGGVYLRPETNVELLNCRWYVWQHTLSPVQHAMNLAYRQLPLLQAFVSNSSVHVAASKDPALLGGPFVDLTEEQVPEVKTLIVNIHERCSHLLVLAKAIKDLFFLLSEKGKGYSLDSIYGSLPDSIKGLVELVYDLQNAATIKIREELIYEDALSNSRFKEIALTLTNETERKFFINTPRIPGAGQLFLPFEFDDPCLDVLASARLKPMPLDLIGTHLGLGNDTSPLQPFVTPEAPIRKQPNYRGENVRIRYFGHACVTVETAKTSFLIDPRFSFRRDDRLATLTFHDLPDFIDYVFISHSHQDHFCAETLVQLRGRIGKILVPRNNPGSICDPSLKLSLSKLGFNNVEVLDSLQTIPALDGQILSLPFPGEHCGLDVQSKHCALVQFKGRRILFLVDSDAVDPALYTRLKRHIGKVDAVFIGMECNGAPLTWLYGPLLPKSVPRRDDQSRRGNGSNCERAWAVIRELGCSNVYIYAMGMEPWNQHLLGLEYESDSVQIKESNDLLRHCRAAGIQAERLRGCMELEFSDVSVLEARGIKQYPGLRLR